MSTTHAWLVTGTDTNIGKTFVTCALLHAARARGLSTLGVKPVAAGAREIDGQLCNEDTVHLMKASSVRVPMELVTPYCMQAAVAPHIAAAEEGVKIDPAHIVKVLNALRRRADVVLIEGAGGLLVPICDSTNFADLARKLGLPIILVVGMRLGCINHALLTVEVIETRGLTLAGWIANRIDPDMLRFDENLATLRGAIAAPLLGIAPHGTPENAATALTLPG